MGRNCSQDCASDSNDEKQSLGSHAMVSSWLIPESRMERGFTFGYDAEERIKGQGRCEVFT